MDLCTLYHSLFMSLSALVWTTVYGLNSTSSDDHQTNKDISSLLDSLVRNYEAERQFRPDFGGPPVQVTTNILIRSVTVLTEADTSLQIFSINCYFRQSWSDSRLSFTPIGNITELRPSVKMLDMIWKPDTYFLNGRTSYLHIITSSNKLFRITREGRILYSQRLTIQSSCPMNLQKYPMDSQECPLSFGSFGYSTKDVEYIWKNMSEPVKKYKDITLAQFQLGEISTDQKIYGHSQETRSVLCVTFGLTREIGYYLLQFYLPCYLIVIISWVSFWINREATPARVTLGITTLLTTCTIAITGRTGIPKVSYSTALDIFLLMCFSFVFAALIEYAGVNYFTKTVIKDVQDESDEENEIKPLLRTATYSGGQSVQHTLATDINGHTVVSVNKDMDKESCLTMFLHCLRGNSKYRHFKSMKKTGPVSVSKIDSMARILFPFSFVCLNIFYWAGYMYYF